jgi:hypothetical protein
VKVAPTVLIACKNKVSFAPLHTGVLLVIVTGGVAVTVTVIAAVTEQDPTATTTVYTPDEPTLAG